VRAGPLPTSRPKAQGEGGEADLASARQAEGLVSRCQARGVKLVCAVNNASIFELDRAPTATAAAFDKHMAINLRAPMLIARRWRGS